MEINNILFIQENDVVYAYTPSAQKQEFLEKILKDNNIFYTDEGTAKIYYEDETYQGLINSKKFKIKTSLDFLKENIKC